MLQDYRNYIVNIRNSLIQCGVDVPVSPLSSYREIFYEADRLRQILWFYRVMAVSGSSLALEGFLIDLKGYYKEKMRQQFYSDFRDYYNSYKNISSLALMAGESNIGDVEESSDEFDLFSGNDTVNERSVEEGTSVNYDSEEVYEEVHGTFIDDLNIYADIDKVLGNGYIPSGISVSLIQQVEDTEIHGTMLDELEEEGVEDEVHGVILDLVEESVEDALLEESGEVHGTILDELGSSDEEYIDYDEDEYNDIHYSDDSDVEYSDEEDVYDDIHYSDDEEEVYDDIHYSDDEEDEEVYDDIHYSDDDEEDFGDKGVYDDIHYSDDEGDVDYIETKPVVKNPIVPVVNTTVASGDLSDVISDKVNDLLTRGKRFLVSESRKLRNGDKN